MSQPAQPASTSALEGCIALVRGQRVMLDSQLADIYGIPTKALNQAVRRNPERCPQGFVFQLTRDEAGLARKPLLPRPSEGACGPGAVPSRARWTQPVTSSATSRAVFDAIHRPVAPAPGATVEPPRREIGFPTRIHGRPPCSKARPNKKVSP